MLVPLGPVAVFGASNFPFAFGVPGGDTAAALAVGCPVVVKGHPAHPATSELCGRAVSAAVQAAGAPDGTFSLLQGRSADVGRALVLAPQVKAVGFTGSTEVGRALFDLAAGRPEPIPVYAEMGSINPVFLTPGALAERGPVIADGLAASMTLSTGQFCTSPGLVVVPDDEHGRDFTDRLTELLRQVPDAPMLTAGIRAGLHRRLARTARLDGVQVLVGGADDEGGTTTGPTLLRVDHETFAASPEMLAEHFGPAALVVSSPTERYAETARHLEGNLTATVHGTADEAASLAELQSVLVEKAGRIVWNGFPTGVAVTAAQHHGGPYPATTAPAHTSVGVTSVLRFLRAVAFQDTPAALLPPELQDDNPLGILRQVDGAPTRNGSAPAPSSASAPALSSASAPALWRLQLPDGVRLAAGPPDAGPQHLLPASVDLDQLLRTGGSALREAVNAPTGEPVPSTARVLCPLQGQEVWAAGVTFERSRTARNEEAGPVDFYDRVYAADRPELFAKAAVGRSRGPGEPVAVRADSGWDVPEPELAVVADAAGRIVAYTVGNDMSSRNIEGENPLYLPQAKVYEGSCSVGPCLLPVEDGLPPSELNIELSIERDGAELYADQVSVATMHRELEELVDWLFRGQDFPLGVALLTGTSIVPPPEFTLRAGDVVTVRIPGVGTLRNPVEVRDTRRRRP
jgi:NADP-dependent aldehyde dehydrogenase